MATRIDTWYEQDITKPVVVRYLDGNVFSQDSSANRIGVNLYENGEPYSITGTISANIIRSDGVTVPATGSFASNHAWVNLPQAAYAVPGVISIIIKETNDGVITTLCAVVANVYQSSTDSVIDPGTILPSIQTLIDAINAAVESIPADYSNVLAAIAPTYSTSSSYKMGDYVWYSGGLYRCVSSIATGETWNSGHWAGVSIGPDLHNGGAVVPRYSISDVFPGSSSYSLDDLPDNTIVDIPSASISAVTEKPSHFTTGFSVISLNSRYPSQVGEMQIALCYDRRVAYRQRTTSWQSWYYLYDFDFVHTYQCKASGGDFSDLAFGLKFLDQHFDEWNAHNYAIIEVDEGTFSLSSAVGYISNGDIEERGLYLPPYCKIKGKGKDKTKIRFLYTGSDSTFMYNVSGINMPYESSIEDVTIEVQNMRYAIHSDGGMGWYMKDGTTRTNVTNNPTLINNCSQKLKNVRLIHRGFEAGKTPIDPSTGQEYKTPAAWGSGSWDNTLQDFDGCDFVSLQNAPWFNHNRDTLTKPSKFHFKNCTFVNGLETNPQLNLTYAGLGLISWGSGIRDEVILQNCFLNHAIALYNTGTAVCDYYVYCDNDTPVIETRANNSYLLNNFITGECKTGLMSVDQRAYAPVSKEFRKNLVKYDPTLPFAGITLYSASANEQVIYQVSGWVYIPSLTTNSDLFLKGKKLGYDNANNEWIEDNNNPIIDVINYNVGVIVK